MRAFSFFLFYALIACADICFGASIVGEGETKISDFPQWAGVIVSVGVVILIVTLLIGCAEICKKGNSGFEDLTDETMSRPGNDLVIFPPVESTPDSHMTGPPIIEPLPDLESIKKPSISNILSLRPKVALLNEPEAKHERNSMQEKIKLQNIIIHHSSNKTLGLYVDPMLGQFQCRNQLSREKLNYVKGIGEGWFGRVLQGDGKDLLPGYRKSKVVVLELNESADPHDQLNFLLEASAYREVQHENVLKLHGQCVERTPFLLVLEHCTFGDLKQYLVGHKVAFESISEKGLLLRFACDIAAGLKALHEAKYIHRDIAIRNCLLSSDLTCKIGDYLINETNYKDEYYTDPNGDKIPIRWLAPETVKFENKFLKLNNPTEMSNVWSYGVVLWEIMTFGSLPYSCLEDELVIKNVLKDKQVLISKPDLPIRNIDKVFELMELCCSVNPKSRPSLRELRIMLLQLLTVKVNEGNNDAFEEKWNKLLPKKPAQSVDVREMDENGLKPDKPIDLDLADVHLTNKYPNSAKPIEASPINELCLQDELSSLQHKKRHTSSSSESDVIVLDEKTDMQPNSTSTPAPKGVIGDKSILKNDSISETFHTALTSQISQSSEVGSFSSKLDSSKFAAMLDTVGPLSLDASSETVSEDEGGDLIEASVETIKNDEKEQETQMDNSAKEIDQPTESKKEETKIKEKNTEPETLKTEEDKTKSEETKEDKKELSLDNKDTNNIKEINKTSTTIVTNNVDNENKIDEKHNGKEENEACKLEEAVVEQKTSNNDKSDTSSDKNEQDRKDDKDVVDLDQEGENEDNKSVKTNETNEKKH